MLAVADLETGRVYWTATQCADHIGISRATWAAYASRDQCPAPAERFEGLRLWDASEVRAWHAARPSQQRRG
ncbi:hypothetical protein H7347_07300 [Corynebacterium sp. zg-331]|nr:hypothetical protein [Corynebacterium sp. zg-331]MPV52866.1 hypothetical protein [Corynebacterium sp. zg331]